jgi:hypothetical protein
MMKITIEIDPKEVVILGEKFARPVSVEHAKKGLEKAIGSKKVKHLVDSVKLTVLSNALDIARFGQVKS